VGEAFPVDFGGQTRNIRGLRTKPGLKGQALLQWRQATDTQSARYLARLSAASSTTSRQELDEVDDVYH